MKKQIKKYLRKSIKKINGNNYLYSQICEELKQLEKQQNIVITTDFINYYLNNFYL